MPKIFIFLLIFTLTLTFSLYPQTETFRASVDGAVEVSLERRSEIPVNIGINSAVIINIGSDYRFLRGIELEITAPQNWLQYRGSLMMMMYNNINPVTALGAADITGSRIAFETLPSRLRIIYHIPIRALHGLRTTTTVIVPSQVIQPASFPVMFRLMQISKGMPEDFEKMTFGLIARPILSDEGAVRLIPRYPPMLRNRPFTVLINDSLIPNIGEEIVLREGEHHLVVLSDDYRNESRRFMVERGRIIELTLDLQDPTPLIIFEGPHNTQVFLNNVPISSFHEPIPIEPGTHEVWYQIGDYTVIRTLNIQRGKTYRVSLTVDLTVQEED